MKGPRASAGGPFDVLGLLATRGTAPFTPSRRCLDTLSSTAIAADKGTKEMP